MAGVDNKKAIQAAINAFSKGDLTSNALNLFKALGYNTERQAPLDRPTRQEFKETYGVNNKLNEDKALFSDWRYIDLLFQLSKDEILKQTSLFDNNKVDRTIIETYLFFVIELAKDRYSRTELANITREVNKLFPMPAMLLFKHGQTLTLSVINRRLHKKDDNKDVLEKVSLIKDINIERSHRAHLEILFELSFDELKRKFDFKNFVELHNAWQKTLDTKELNKRFYEELFKWYLWAVKNVEFPQIRPKSDLIDNIAHQNESVIRLLTRLLFCWFMKEKQQLIPDILFDRNEVTKILKNFNPNKKDSAVYYRAILQNLFFATLSVPIKERKYIRESFHGANVDHGNQYVFRYQEEFNNHKENLNLFKDIPFLNGGLFDSLDRRKDEDNPEEIRLDGFSSKPKKQAFVPDFIFWGAHKGIDLSKELDNPRRKNETIHGVFDILNAYKFTIEENTPIEEEIALDPDLLGRTFENLLAYYAPETKSNARKQTGSFYTPREIVDYMVDESLFTYFKHSLKHFGDEQLRNLISYTASETTLTTTETKEIIQAIESLKVMDPACGSGAFPMGVLHKLVWILHKIDPENKLWFDSLISRLPEYTQAEMRSRLGGENWNYLRKLGIIQQSIYGIDIQPIAIQIAKLRFFISLVVEQKIKDTPQNNFGLLPLPNLDFKLVCANALISAPDDFSGTSLQFTDKFSEQFAIETTKYFSAYLPRDKKKLTENLKALVHAKMNEKLAEIEKRRVHTGDVRFSKHVAVQNKTLIEKKLWDARLWKSYGNLFKHESVGFFDTKYFFPEVSDGFDIVIGNPPYGAKFSDMEKEYFKRIYKHQDYQPESFLFFTERSFFYLKDKGILSFIIPNTWLTNLKLVKIRKFLTSKNTIINISHYQKSVFDAVVDTEVVIFKKGYLNDNKIKVYNHIDSSHVEEIIHDQDKWKHLNGGIVNIFATKEVQQVVDKIRVNCIPLSDVCDVTTGMKPYQVGKGNPKQTKSEVENRIFDSVSKLDESYLPLLRGSDIDKFETRWAGDRWIKYGDWLAEPRYSAKFDSEEKIVIRQTGDSLVATIDTHQFICMNNLHVINKKDDGLSLYFLLALLNSSILNFYFHYLNPEEGEALAEVKKENVENLVIRRPLNEKPFATVTKYILLLKILKKDSSFFQQLLDAMIYELYMPEVIRQSDCEVLTYLNQLPEIDEISEVSAKKKFKVIEECQRKLSDQNHPISEAMFKMDTIEEVRIIEGNEDSL